MPITRTAISDDDGSGRTGTVIDNAWKQELYNQIDAYVDPIAGGVWTNIAFNAANFSAVGGSWAVASHTTFAYLKQGKTVYLAFYTTGTTITGAPSALTINLTTIGPWTIARQLSAVYNYFNGTTGAGFATATAGSTSLLLHKDILGTAWAAGGCYITGVFILNVT